MKIPRWGALWPCPQTPRPGSSVIGVNVLGANKRALRYLNSLYLVGLFQNPATARRADSPVPGARCPGISQCNLSLFYSDWAERSSRVGLRPNALAFGEICPPNIHQNLYQSGSWDEPHRTQSFVHAQSGRNAKQQRVCRRDTVPMRNGISATGGSATRITCRLSLLKIS